MKTTTLLRQYDIDVVALENKEYFFKLEGNSLFFEAFEQKIIQNGNFVADVTLRKTETMLQILLDITGDTAVICDRSNEPYEENFSTKQKLLLKFADRNEEIDETLELIERGTQTINLAKYLFEFIALTIPMKKLHPRFRTEMEEDYDDEQQEGILIYSSSTNENTNQNADTNIDPRWAALSKLKNNNN